MSRSAVVIEDDIRIGELVRLLVEKCGFQVDLERDGTAGLKQVRNRRPDLVVTDMLLPGLHGLDICKAIRTDANLQHVKIVAVTAVFRSRQFQLDARGLRFDALLEKPFDIHQLRDAIGQLFPGACDQENDPGPEQKGASDQVSMGDLIEPVTRLERRWEQYRVYPDRRRLLQEMLDELGRLTGMTAFGGDRALSELFAEMKQVIQGFAENRGAILKSQATRLDESFVRLKDTLGMPDPQQNNSFDQDRKEPVRPEEFTAHAMSDPLDNQPDRNICLVTDESERFDNLAKGLGVFGYRLICRDWVSAGQGECPELFALLIDLQSYMKDPEPDRLSHMERLRRHGGEDIPAMVLAGQSSIADHIVQELVRHGCWNFYSGPLDGFGLVSHLQRMWSGGDIATDRLLIVDDQSLGEYVQIILKEKGFLTETVRSISQVQSTVDAFRPDLVLVGEGLGRVAAIGVIRFLRSMDADIPVVLIAETPDAELLQSASEAGCADVLPLGLTEDRMALTLRSRMRTYSLSRQARDYDGVTGALHFSQWMMRLERDHRWAKERGTPFLCATIQLDNLAGLNRQYGAVFSDRLLKALVLLLGHRFRNRAVVCRDGAARFSIYMGDLGSRDAAEMLNSFVRLFSSIPFFHGTGTRYASVSAGVAMCQPHDTHYQLLNRAGSACKRARARGGNGVVVLEK